MTQRRGLGKGLDALIPAAPGQAGVTELPIDSIRPNPRQPRAHMDSAELDDLAASIREHGIIQPLIVSQEPGALTYTLVAGERRLQAARRAGLKAVPVLVREASEQQLLEIALIENVQRADLGPTETAEAFRQLADDFGLSHEEIAQRVGKKRVTVTNTLRLLKLPAKVLEALDEGKLSEGHARAILALPNAQAQQAAVDTIIRKGLNVRQVEELVRRLNGKRPAKPAKKHKSEDLKELESQLREALGTKVNLNPGRKGSGTISIHYYSDEELNAITEAILGN